MSSIDVENYLWLVKAVKVGKKVNGYLYVHKSALESTATELYRLLKSFLACIPTEYMWNIAKLSLSKPTASFLDYPNFQFREHPQLRSSLKADLSVRNWAVRDFSGSANPPILHRKETFIAPGNPEYERFANLTREEEEHGLFAAPHRIGHLKQWTDLLKIKNLRVVEHHVFSIAQRRPVKVE